MSQIQLQRHIRKTAARTESIFLTAHAKQRMQERDVLMTEVIECLRRGGLPTPPEEDMKTGQLICRMTWYGSGRNLVVCVALDDEDPHMIVVTVIAN